MARTAIGVVTITALVDSVNPCAIGVLILLASMLLVLKSRKELLLYGLLYILAVFATYILAGLGILYFLNTIPLALSEYISIIVGIVIVIAGLIEMKDYFWYGQGISLAISPKRAKQIHEMTRRVTLPGVVLLGVFVAAVELPCTGAPYMAILLLIYTGTKVQKVKRWKMQNRATMRLAIGITLVLLGWILILIANGTINLA